MTNAALRTAQQEAERLLRERRATAGQGYRCPPTPFRRWRDDGSGGRGVVGQGGHAYEVVVRYRVYGFLEFLVERSKYHSFYLNYIQTLIKSDVLA